MTENPSENPMFQSPTQAQQALEYESRLPMTGWQQEVSHGLEYGLEAAASIRDRTIPTFSRGELPHYAGINTFMKAPYLEDVRKVGEYDVAIVGVPHDSGTTYRPGTRFGPQGIRRISALYTPYHFELGVDLREQITLVMWAIFLRFRLTMRSLLTKSRKEWLTSLPLAHFRFF